MKRMKNILAWMPTLTLAVLILSATLLQPGLEKWIYLTAQMNRDFVSQVPFTLNQTQVEAVFRDRLQDFSPGQAPKLASHLIKLCQEHDFDPAFVLSVIQVESTFRTKAVSPVGATGLMQLMPSTAEYVAQRWNLPEKGNVQLRNPYSNIKIGVIYLAYLREKYNGKKSHYLAAYLAGPAKIDQHLERKNGVIKSKAYQGYVESIQREIQEVLEYRFRPAVRHSDETLG